MLRLQEFCSLFELLLLLEQKRWFLVRASSRERVSRQVALGEEGASSIFFYAESVCVWAFAN